MLKKKLPPLAASLLLASQANAISFEPDGNVLMVFNTAEHGSYWLDSGIAVGDFTRLGYSGFQIELSGIRAALGGSIEQFGLVASFGNPAGYADEGLSILYASANDLTPGQGTAVTKDVNAFKNFLASTQLGHNPEGSAGDVDAIPTTIPSQPYSIFSNFLSDYQQVNDVQLWQRQRRRVSFATNSAVAIWVFSGWEECPNGPYPDPNDGDCPYFYTTSSSYIFEERDGILWVGWGDTLITTSVPLPASAWLFCGAIAGLAASKRINRNIASAE